MPLERQQVAELEATVTSSPQQVLAPQLLAWVPPQRLISLKVPWLPILNGLALLTFASLFP